MRVPVNSSLESAAVCGSGRVALARFSFGSRVGETSERGEIFLSVRLHVGPARARGRVFPRFGSLAHIRETRAIGHIVLPFGPIARRRSQRQRARLPSRPRERRRGSARGVSGDRAGTPASQPLTLTASARARSRADGWTGLPLCLELIAAHDDTSIWFELRSLGDGDGSDDAANDGDEEGATRGQLAAPAPPREACACGFHVWHTAARLAQVCGCWLVPPPRCAGDLSERGRRPLLAPAINETMR